MRQSYYCIPALSAVLAALRVTLTDAQCGNPVLDLGDVKYFQLPSMKRATAFAKCEECGGVLAHVDSEDIDAIQAELIDNSVWIGGLDGEGDAEECWVMPKAGTSDEQDLADQPCDEFKLKTLCSIFSGDQSAAESSEVAGVSVEDSSSQTRAIRGAPEDDGIDEGEEGPEIGDMPLSVESLEIDITPPAANDSLSVDPLDAAVFEEALDSLPLDEADLDLDENAAVETSLLEPAGSDSEVDGVREEEGAGAVEVDELELVENEGVERDGLQSQAEDSGLTAANKSTGSFNDSMLGMSSEPTR